MRKSRPAFTLIEVMVVSIIIGILAISMAVSFKDSRRTASYNSNRDEIYNFFQKARGLSFNSIYVNDTEELDYYLLTVKKLSISLVAVGQGGETETIDTLNIADGLNINFHDYYPDTSKAFLYYFPPYGTLCLVDSLANCLDQPDWTVKPVGDAVYIPLVTQDPEDDYDVVFSISTHGGFVEIQE